MDTKQRSIACLDSGDSRFPIRRLDKLLRSLAHDILDYRDRLSGWKLHRKEFLDDAGKNREFHVTESEAKLRNILVHAYETSPYYRKAWEAIGFRPSVVFNLDDLQQLPFLTKDIIREQKALLLSERFQRHELDISATGGTTGTQTSFYMNHACMISRVGRQRGILELCGYRCGMRRALVWGVHSDLPLQDVRGNFKQWFRQYASNQETLCCAVMNDQMMMDYHSRLLRFRPEVLYGYPSALTQLGRFIQDRGLEPILVNTIITTAERLSGANRRQLNRLFGGEVFNLYCTREHGCIGFECERHHGLHIDTGSIYMEIIKDGQRVMPGQPGEIVITDLFNYGMPFIRSRTGDMGMYSQRPCDCGSPLPLLKELHGRSSDLVYRPDGSVVPGLMLTDLFTDLPSIRFAQFVQDNVKQLDVLLVVTEAFSEQVQTVVARQVCEIMGNEIEIRIKLVNDISRNPRSGKIEELICKVDPRKVWDSLGTEA